MSVLFQKKEQKASVDLGQIGLDGTILEPKSARRDTREGSLESATWVRGVAGWSGGGARWDNPGTEIGSARHEKRKNKS